MPRVTDAQWSTILQHIADTFGHELWHRCRLIHQTDEVLGRYSTAFPESVPQPYRHIRYLELLVQETLELHNLKRWLTDRGIEWRTCRDQDPDGKQNDFISFQVYGYDANIGG